MRYANPQRGSISMQYEQFAQPTYILPLSGSTTTACKLYLKLLSNVYTLYSYIQLQKANEAVFQSHCRPGLGERAWWGELQATPRHQCRLREAGRLWFLANKPEWTQLPKHLLGEYILLLGGCAWHFLLLCFEKQFFGAKQRMCCMYWTMRGKWGSRALPPEVTSMFICRRQVVQSLQGFA